MFITEAFAQTGGGATGGGGIADLLASPFFVLIPIFLIMYFLVLRPNQQKQRAHRELVANLRRGDTVVTSGGLIGKVAKVEEGEVQVELAEGVRVRVIRGMIADVRSKAEPVKEAAT
jgi:preprotein translocase subunit YajC